MPKKTKVKQKQRQSQKQIVNINLGKPTKKRGKRKTQIKKPVLYQSVNYSLSQPQQLPSFTSQTPSLIPPPVARSSAPVTTSAVDESLIVPAPIVTEPKVIAPIIESSEVQPLTLPIRPIRPIRPIFPVREELPAFVNIEPIFAEPSLVPYQTPLSAPDELFDIPKDPFNLEQPPVNPFNVEPAVEPALEEEQTEYLPYSPSQIEDLRTKTALYTKAEPFGPSNESFFESFFKTESPTLELAVERPEKKRLEKKGTIESLLKEKEMQPLELAVERPEKKRLEKKGTIESLLKEKETPPLELAVERPEKKRLEKKGMIEYIEPKRRGRPKGSPNIPLKEKLNLSKGGLERVRPEEQTEEPLQYGFSN